MKVDFWIKIPVRKEKYGPEPRGFEVSGVPSSSKGKPRLGQSEFAFKVNLEIPDDYFREPELKIDVKMPEVDSSPYLSVEIAENIGEIIRSQIGVNAHVSISADDETNQ